MRTHNFTRPLKFIVVALVILGEVSCSSTTLIRSSDAAAKIFADGEFKGRGTAAYTDTKIVGSSTSIKIEKDGCEPVFYNISRNEEFDAGACAGGVFVLVPFLWIMRYKPEHFYEYRCTPLK